MSQTMQNRSLRIKALIFSSLSMSLFLFSACSDFKRAIGSEKSSPDEFEVVVRPPLSLPPQFSSRPVSQDTDTAALAASNTLDRSARFFNQGVANAKSFSDLFAFDQIEEDVRTKVDEETAGIRFERRLPLQIIFGGLPNVGPVVDKMGEDARIRRNKLQNRAINKGATPAIDQVLNEPVFVR